MIPALVNVDSCFHGKPRASGDDPKNDTDAALKAL